MSTTNSLELLRTPSEKLVVSSSEFRETTIVHVRLHARFDSGEWVPTKKGIIIRDPGELDQVVDTLQALRPVLPGPAA